MKLLCSLLILAGVFALNDASISYEEQQMRLAKDTKMLEDLKRMALNRDVNSIKCSQDLLAGLGGVLDNYNTAVSTCNKTKDDEISAANAIAEQKILGFGSVLENTCDSLTKCSSDGEPIDKLVCLDQESSQTSRILTGVSNDASTAKIELQKAIDSANANVGMCKQQAYNDYSKESERVNNEFTDCINGKPSNGGKTTTKTAAPTPTEESDGGNYRAAFRNHGKF